MSSVVVVRAPNWWPPTTNLLFPFRYYYPESKPNTHTFKLLKSATINFNLARIGSRKLQTVSAAERACAVNALADLLTSKQQRILEANATDLAEATKAGLATPLLSRLSLSAGKLNNLATGLRQIADSSEKVSF